MNRETVLKLISLVLFLICFLGVAYYFSKLPQDKELHIALVAPLSGEDKEQGQQLKAAVELYLAELNEKGGIEGHLVRLDVYDDKNDPNHAKQSALEIVEQNRALAVIGHSNSMCSLAGGEIYRKYGIPALTPSATDNAITADNPWYFRTVFNELTQGRALAQYAKHVLKEKNVNIISYQDTRNRYLADVFKNTSDGIGLSTTHHWQIKMDNKIQALQMRRIVKQLKKQRQSTLILLSSHWEDGVKWLKAIRDAGIDHPVLVPMSFANPAFSRALVALPNEQNYPGYYTDQLYIATPFIFDTTNHQGQHFYEKFLSTYGQKPRWFSAFAYDAAHVLTTAIKNRFSEHRDSELAQKRKAIQHELEQLNQPELAIEGVTGLNYFDADGNAKKSIQMGNLKGETLVSSLTQLKAVGSARKIANLEQALASGTVLQVDDQLMYKTDVVYTGIQVNEISELDIKTLSYNVDFFIWFRFKTGFNVQDVHFINATAPIKLDTPDIEKIQGSYRYLRYHVNGQFQTELSKGFLNLHKRRLSIEFHHRQLSHNNLIYVTDIVGLGLIKPDKEEQAARYAKILNSAAGWEVRLLNFYQDTKPKQSLGDPDLLSSTGSELEYSRFTAEIQVHEIEFSLRQLLPYTYALEVTLTSVFILIIAFLLRHQAYLKQTRLLWFVYLLSSFFILISLETVGLDMLKNWIHPENLKSFVTLFDVLWWFVPALFINLSLEYFIWHPLEYKTGRHIPSLVRRFAAFIIYLLALFGVVAFVFEQKLTGLLATSSVIAMIIGLAIQLNISHIFSGIALNLERSFSVGDWIKMEDYDEGQVVDMNWRTTRIRTRAHNLVRIPNTKIAEAILVSFNEPTNAYGSVCRVHVHPQHPPNKVIKVLKEAMLSVNDDVLKEPPPTVLLRHLTDCSAEYLVIYFSDQYPRRFLVRSEVWVRLWHHLVYAGMPPAMPHQEVQLTRNISDKKEGVPLLVEDILERVELFEPLPTPLRQRLSDSLSPLHFSNNETVFYQGDKGDSMFLVAQGVVGVWVKSPNQDEPQHLAQLGAGCYFGEIALMRKIPRTATIVATTNTILFEITKKQLDPILSAQPSLVGELNTVLERRTQQLGEYLAKFDISTIKESEEDDSFFSVKLFN